jgi:hypothetical protein
MVSLRQDSNGNFIARKRLPEDVREEYGCHSACNFDPLSRGIGVQN